MGVITHGGLRLYFASRRKKTEKLTERVYMYGSYERLWHWLQTAAIVLLLLTGMVIHRPDTFGFIDFNNMVLVHNIIAAILAVNAFLALFYHLASGEIKQYIPKPRGFFDRTITQALYYLNGIFKGDHHPFEKTPEKKLNPLQQVTYFGLLNVLLPLQGITGTLMWGVQRWPSLANALGGLPILAPVHTILAWLFASFIILHVYLTTTGHTAVSSLEAMITGWEELEN
jgi:thiosulfate reductase cytochrome b subunit